MINAITITKARYKDARCLVASEPGNDRGLSYYIIVEDGEDDFLGWGYSPDEAWDDAALNTHRKQVNDLVDAAVTQAKTKARKEYKESFAFVKQIALKEVEL